MRQTGSFVDVDHPLGTVGLLLLLVVARLVGPAHSAPTTAAGQASGVAARRALDIVGVIGWLCDRLPQRGTATVRDADTSHRAAAANRTTATVWMKATRVR